MRIAYIASEVVPFAKTGGLADVAGALPPEIEKTGHEVCVFMPFYDLARRNDPRARPTGVHVQVPIRERQVGAEIMASELPNSKVPVYFVRNDAYFGREQLYGDEGGDYSDNCERFVFFCRAVLEAISPTVGKCDVVHCNDWQTGLVPAYMKTLYRTKPGLATARSVFTVHNLAYQGMFSHLDMPITGLDWSLYNWRQLEFYDHLNLLKGGLVFADALTTVSERYAEEIQTEEFGCGLDGVLRERAQDLYGIINGVDYSVWDPSVDPLIPAQFTPEEMGGKDACKKHLRQKCGLPEATVPVIGLVSRLADQKGLDLIAEIIDEIMRMDVQLVVLGTGDAKYHRVFEAMAARYPDQMSANLLFDNTFAHEIEAGADMFLMPSRYEPCGLNQFYSLRYGTVPIVRETGGLADSITDFSSGTLAEGRANGFSFMPYEGSALMDAILRAVDAFGDDETWRKLMQIGMRQDWSWASSARKYVSLYEKVLAS